MNIYEILEEFTWGEDEYERIDILKRNDNKLFRDVLTATYNPSIEFVDVDWDAIQWKERQPTMYGDTPYLTMRTEFNSIYLFIKGHPKASPNLTNERRAQILKQILESMHPRESKVYLGMLKKNLGIENLDVDIIRKAFPDIPI